MQLIGLVIIFFHVLSGSSFAQQFNLLEPANLWRSPNLETKIEISPYGLTISSTTSSTGIFNLRPLNILTENHDLLIIKMRTSTDGIGEVSWASKNLIFHPLQSYPFYLKRPGQYNTYYLNLSAYHRKNAPINHLLFFPFHGPGTAEIKEFKFIHGNFWQKILAGWQEFWGPRGREPDKFNFLVIRSPRILGGPAYRYLNCFLLLALIVTFFLSLKINLRHHFLITLLVAWTLMEISSLVNNWIAFQRDKVFWGKSLEEKRTMVNPKDFYSFLKFAEHELPAHATFDLLTDLPYGRDKARYYLFPQKITEKPQYLLVFEKKIESDYRKRFTSWKKFRDGAFILRRKP